MRNPGLLNSLYGKNRLTFYSAFRFSYADKGREVYAEVARLFSSHRSTRHIVDYKLKPRIIREKGKITVTACYIVVHD